MESNADMMQTNPADKTTRYTPRQLINYHMEHPDIPITDENIENLVLNGISLEDDWEAKQTSFEENKEVNYAN